MEGPGRCHPYLVQSLSKIVIHPAHSQEPKADFEFLLKRHMTAVTSAFAAQCEYSPESWCPAHGLIIRRSTLRITLHDNALAAASADAARLRPCGTGD